MIAEDIHIVALGPLRVASFLGFGSEPELQALQKLMNWATSKGFMERIEEHRIFGFNNPNPSPGSPNYGYEFWITVGPEVETEAELEVKEIPAERYAVARCEVRGNPGEAIPAAWKRLVAWREESSYQQASHQWLEEHLNIANISQGVWDMDLYLPITE
jgi:AraC family transcriptional regulator